MTFLTKKTDGAIFKEMDKSIPATVALRFFDLPPCGVTLGNHKKNWRDGRPPELERQVDPVVLH